MTYTPEQAITHEIEVTFNGEQVTGEPTKMHRIDRRRIKPNCPPLGSPFLCRVTDGEEDEDMLSDTSGSGFDRVRVELDHLSLVPVGAAAAFTIRVAGGDDAELAVSVQGRFFLKKNPFLFSPK